MKRIVRTKFESKCNETGLKIPKGTEVLYDYNHKRCYAIASKFTKHYLQTKFAMKGVDNEAKQ
jgi:hypothetical protein